MHPDLVNNPTFLRYYSRWQADPTSVAFVGVADFLREYRLYADALRVCEAGLQQNPELISGRLVLARIHLDAGDRAAAEVQLRWILDRSPNHADAIRLLGGSVAVTVASIVPPAPAVADAPLATVTMARLYERQGYREQAAIIYRLILERDPRNREAEEALQSLGTPAHDATKS